MSVDVILCQRDRTSCSIDLPLKKTALTLIEQQCHPLGLVDLELWHATNKYFVIIMLIQAALAALVIKCNMMLLPNTLS